MVKEVTRTDMGSCKIFDTSSTVQNASTITAKGNPLLVNISVNNHGELSSRETCRYLRPYKENTLDTSSAMTRISSSETSNKMNLHQNSSLPGMPYTTQLTLMTHNVNLETQQHRDKMMAESNFHSLPAMTSYLLLDELNTPEIGLNTEFTFDTNCIGSSAAAASDLSVIDHDAVWGEAVPINNTTNSTIDLFNCFSPAVTSNNNDSTMVNSTVKRPVELRLRLQTTHAPCTGLTPNVDPIMNLDTPDVLQHIDDAGESFNLLSYMDDRTPCTNVDKSRLSVLDSPQLFPRNSYKAVTIKREQSFVEEDVPQNQLSYSETVQINLVEDNNQEVEFLNCFMKPDIKPENTFLHPVVETSNVNKPEIPYLNSVVEMSKINEPEIPYLNSVVDTSNVEIKQETFTPPPSIPSPINEVEITSLKRSSRLMSRESTSKGQYTGEDISDTDSDYTSTSYQSSVKRPRLTLNQMVKPELEEDASSIASSALEMKYSELRQRNNEASRKSRQNRKSKESIMEDEAQRLGAHNRRLKGDVDKLEHLVLVLRKALLDSVTRANNK